MGIGKGEKRGERERLGVMVSGWRLMMMMMMMMVAESCSSSGMKKGGPPKPRAWPEQFHALLVMNNSHSGELQVVDLWYDWPKGRNLNLIQHQLGKLLYDVEWNNGTSFFFTRNRQECRSSHFEVGILRPNWLDGATYLGQRHIDGFLCNVWQKADFIWYYEDVLTRRPVHWLFYTGRAVHVMTFEVGAVLEDSEWQAPLYCFHNNHNHHQIPPAVHFISPLSSLSRSSPA